MKGDLGVIGQPVRRSAQQERLVVLTHLYMYAQATSLMPPFPSLSVSCDISPTPLRVFMPFHIYVLLPRPHVISLSLSPPFTDYGCLNSFVVVHDFRVLWRTYSSWRAALCKYPRDRSKTQSRTV